MQCWGLLGAMGSPAGALARGLRRDAPAPVVAGADIVVVGVLRYEVVDAEAGALAPVVLHRSLMVRDLLFFRRPGPCPIEW